MLFKGTAKRSALQIAEEIEGRGGALNAFTDKENTCYYCRVLAEDTEVGIDVLADMVCDSALAEEEMEREKGVVLEEIKRSDDEPSDHVHELHIQALWKDSPFGKPVLGVPDTVSSFSPDDLRNYMARRYNGATILLAVAGNVDPEDVRNWAEESLGGIPAGDRGNGLARPEGAAGENIIAKDIEQVHFCIGGDGVSMHDDDRYAAIVMDGVLGSGMSSRLFQEVREKRGLAYAIGSYMLSYSTGGAFTVFGGTGMKTWQQVQDIVRSEFDKLMKSGAPDGELEKVKKNFAGHVVLALESTSTRMMRMARNEINYGRQIPVEETLDAVRAVTNDQLMTIANRVLSKDNTSTTAIGPF